MTRTIFVRNMYDCAINFYDLAFICDKKVHRQNIFHKNFLVTHYVLSSKVFLSNYTYRFIKVHNVTYYNLITVIPISYWWYRFSFWSFAVINNYNILSIPKAKMIISHFLFLLLYSKNLSFFEYQVQMNYLFITVICHRMMITFSRENVLSYLVFLTYSPLPRSNSFDGVG